MSRQKAKSVRGVAIVALCAIAAAAWVAVQQHSETVAKAANAISDPDPFDLPENTIAIEVSWEGYIRSATQRIDDRTEPADIRALGYVQTDQGDREPGVPIEWDDFIELGAIENAGEERATITFQSWYIIDLEPGEVLFVNNSLEDQQLIDALVAVANCTCQCICQGVGHWCGDNTTEWSCDETNYKCVEFTNDACVVGDPTDPGCSNGTMKCRRVWQFVEALQ